MTALKIDCDREERAAIIEYDGGIPRQWAEGYAKLLTMPRPEGFTEKRWERFLNDAGVFLDQWAKGLAGLGWTTREVFGVKSGLISFVSGGRIIVASSKTAKVEYITMSGDRVVQGFEKKRKNDVIVWELAA